MVADELHPVLFAAIKRATLKDEACAEPWTRRLISIAFAGGLSISHLARVDQSAATLVKDKVSLYFGLASSISHEMVRADFDFAIRWFCKNLRTGLREANLVAGFWGAAASQFFINNAGNWALDEMEWNPQSFDSRFENRRVDFVELLRIDDELFPMVLMEVGVDEAQSAEEHKDFTKISCLLSICCSRLMNFMGKTHRNPHKARCYGLLVGGAKAHCLVAHPILHSGKWCVQITAHPNWAINTLCETVQESVLAVTTPSSNRAIPQAHSIEKIDFNPQKSTFTNIPSDSENEKLPKDYGDALEREEEEYEEEDDDEEEFDGDKGIFIQVFYITNHLKSRP